MKEMFIYQVFISVINDVDVKLEKEKLQIKGKYVNWEFYKENIELIS